MLLIHNANNTTTQLHIASVKSNTNEQRYMATYISPDQFQIHGILVPPLLVILFLIQDLYKQHNCPKIPSYRRLPNELLWCHQLIVQQQPTSKQTYNPSQPKKDLNWR